MEAAWLGHSTLVAAKHYWQLTDADFERAASSPRENEKVAQKTAQQAHAESRSEAQGQSVAHKKPLRCKGLRHFAIPRKMSKCPL